MGTGYRHKVRRELYLLSSSQCSDVVHNVLAYAQFVIVDYGLRLAASSIMDVVREGLTARTACASASSDMSPCV